MSEQAGVYRVEALIPVPAYLVALGVVRVRIKVEEGHPRRILQIKNCLTRKPEVGELLSVRWQLGQPYWIAVIGPDKEVLHTFIDERNSEIWFP